MDEALLRDDALAGRARLGSATAFASLVARHRDTVYIIVRNLCRTDDQAETVLQNTFLTAWRDLPTFPPGAGFTTWLYRIAAKAALLHRARGPRWGGARAEMSLPVFDVAGRLVEAERRRPDMPQRDPECMDLTAELREMLECIDDRARAAFVLCDVAGILPEEAAVILDTSPPAIRRDAHRARLVLRGLIEGTPASSPQLSP